MDAETIILTLKQEVLFAYKESKWLPLATAIAVLSSQIGPFPKIPYFHVPFILLCLCLNLGRHWTFEKACATFLFYLPINIIVADPDPVFQSWTRMAFFALVFALASPLFKGEYLATMRRGILTGVLFITTIIAFGSFFCYFLGINYMKNQADGSALDNFQGSGGSFGGLTIQSIALGLFSGVSILYMFYRSLRQEKEVRIIYWVIMAALAATMLFSASRSALMSTMAGFLAMLYQSQKENGSFIKTLFSMVVVAMLTFPLWEGAAEGIINKQEANNKLEGNYGSRSGKWEARMAEFASSPVFGVGFSAQDPNGNDTYNKITGTIEPGSSWLCILSMTGVIGLVLILGILFSPFIYLRDNPTPYNTLLFGLFVFFCMAFIAEGYIFAGGSSLCFIVWLIFGCASDASEEYFDEDEEDDASDESEKVVA